LHELMRLWRRVGIGIRHGPSKLGEKEG